MLPISAIYRVIGSLLHSANVLLEWLLTYAIHSTLLIGALLLLTSTSFGRQALGRNGSWLWRFALVGALVTASLQSIRSTAPLSGTLRLDGDTPARTTVRVEVNRDRAAVAPSYIVSPVRDGKTVVRSSIKVSPVWPLIVLGSWFVVAAALLSRFLVARARFLRTIGPRTSADHTLAGNALRHLMREGRITRKVHLTISDRLTSPVALGSDEICLPSRAMSELGPVRIESILAHELAHLVRRDPSWLTASRVIEALFFFQPLNILARRRMQESAEFASDAWASARVARPLDLAHCLARVAEWTIAAPRMPVPAMAEGQGLGHRGGVLVRRVERLTTGRVIPEETPGRALRLMAAISLVALILLAPRAAIGADVPTGQFNARLSETANLVVLRNGSAPLVGPRGERVEAVMLRLRQP
jgi:beta-lactamase regulating signal transducer with metallopeptidase domain